ncbi:MAG: cysteine desulfurase family protein [Hyphomicrobiales bacterium]
MRIYLDHNATSPLRPAAREVMLAHMDEPLNPSSVHGEGRAGRKVIEIAREQVAELVGGDPKAVTFTGGGTEANNTVLSPQVQFGSTKRTFDALLVSAVEHPCVLAGGRFSREALHLLPVDQKGVVDLAALETTLKQHEAPFVSVMFANNETGVLQPIDEIAGLVHAHDGFLHVDAVQAAGKVLIDIYELDVDAMTLSAHKIGGPQGVGAIVRLSAGTGVPSLLSGGGQELGYRGGTENVAGIAGFGAAAHEALSGMNGDQRLQEALESGLKALSNDIIIFGDGVARLPNTTCFSLPDKRAETAVIFYDMAGIAISSGSACSSGKVGASHVLKAMGVDDERAAGAIRVSTGWNTRETDIASFLNATQKLLSA